MVICIPCVCKLLLSKAMGCLEDDFMLGATPIFNSTMCFTPLLGGLPGGMYSRKFSCFHNDFSMYSISCKKFILILWIVVRISISPQYLYSSQLISCHEITPHMPCIYFLNVWMDVQGRKLYCSHRCLGCCSHNITISNSSTNPSLISMWLLPMWTSLPHIGFSISIMYLPT